MFPRLTILVILILVLSACAGTGANRLAGRQTKPESRVAIQSGGTHEAYWQTRDLAVGFEYTWQTSTFAVKGAVELSKMIAQFTTLDYLRLRIHFLDEDGVILSTHNVWNAGYRRSLHYNFVNFNFNKQYTPPSGTKIIGFSYSGEASDSGGDGLARRAGGRGDWSFWWQP